MSRHETPSRSAGRANWIFLGFLAIAGYFLLTEHRAHTIPYLPYLLLLACPLMHLFMHGSHGGHGGGHAHGQGAHGCCGGHQHAGRADEKARSPANAEQGNDTPRPSDRPR